MPAIYIAYNKNLLARFIESTIFIPFFFPVVSTIISFTILGNFSFFKKIEFLYSFKGIIIANIFYNTPIFVKYISDGLKKISPNIIEMSQIDGASPTKIFTNIKFPLLLPSILKASFLVFSYCFTSFGVILGIGGIEFSTIEVERATTLFSSFNFSKAFALGILQFLLLFSVNYFSELAETHQLQDEYKLKKEKVSIYTKLIAIIYLVFEYSIVLISIVFAFIDKSTGKFTIKYFLKLFTKDFNDSYPIYKSLINSSLISAITALLTIAFVYFFLKKYSKTTNYVVLSSLGISSAFLGICLIYMNILYNISLFIILILGYFMITVPIAYSYMYHPLRTFDKALIEAGKLDGANNMKIFFNIEFPLLKNIFIGTFIQIFAIIFTEFTISYTMQIKDFLPTISTVNYDMSSNRHFSESTALGALNTIIIIILFLIANINSKKEEL